MQRVLLVFSLLLGCGDDDDAAPDASLDAALDAPSRVDASDELSLVDASRDDVDLDDARVRGCVGPPGLYVAGSCDELQPGLRTFQPEFELWSDGADKERFIYLPPGTTIDTSSPDRWLFPVGTRLYKTFSQEGVRLETRLLEKVSGGAGPSAWAMRVFVWNEAQNEALEATEGVEDALGTAHDVPAATACATCHTGGVSDVPLGFSALQLNHDDAELSLADLRDEGLLSDPITDEAATIPGDETQRAALGYLHANCGNCHGGASPAGLMSLQVLVGLTSVDETATYLSAVGRPARAGAETSVARIDPGEPNSSEVYRRMTLRADPAQMPPLATELLDDEGLDVVRVFIESLR